MACHGCGLFYPNACDYCGCAGTTISADRAARLRQLGGDVEAEPNADPLPADRDLSPDLAAAAVRVGGTDGEAQAAVCGYNRALADSLKSAEKILDQLAKDHWPLVAHASPDPGASQSRWSSASATGSPR